MGTDRGPEILEVRVTDNSSPHWDDLPRRREPQPEQPDPYAELFAVLDRADVSEAVRAAFAHALNPPPSPAGPPDHAEVLVHRHLSGREGGGGHWRRRIDAGNDSRRRYTLHLTFPAANLPAARAKAAAYTEALTVLRPEVTDGPALLSRAEQWNHVEPITCGTTGPEGETCVRSTDHLGCHRDSSTGGLCWGDEPTGDGSGEPPTDCYPDPAGTR